MQRLILQEQQRVEKNKSIIKDVQHVARAYEFPQNDPIYDFHVKQNNGVKKPKFRSNILGNLLVLQSLQENMKVISDVAFNCVDEDGSGGLDTEEISNMMQDIAK